MKNYLSLLNDVLQNGSFKNDRTGVGVKSLFGAQIRFNLSEGFPLVTTKKVFLRGVIVELIWLLRGETNIKYLVDRDVKIWDEWPFQNYLAKNNLESQFPKYSAEWTQEKTNFIARIKSLSKDDEFVQKWGDLGPVYGHQWRNFNGIPHPNPLPKGEGTGKKIDQIKNAIDQIKNNPASRRIIVSAWNPAQIDQMLLPPCHSFFQFYVDETKQTLSLQLYQRSADLFLGVPFNIASYSALLILIAKITGLKAGDFVHTLGDAHIYSNHFEQVTTQLSRTPLPLPKFEIKKDIHSLEDIENLEWDDFELIGYQSHERIVGAVAV